MKKRSHFTKTFELTLIFMKYAVVSISLGLVFLLLANANKLIPPNLINK